jgi:hypothetical protein
MLLALVALSRRGPGPARGPHDPIIALRHE